jgi:hypothetical protein
MAARHVGIVGARKKRRSRATTRAESPGPKLWRCARPDWRHRIEISTNPIVGVVCGGDVADFLERHVAENFAVFEDGFQRVRAERGKVGIAGIVQDFDGGEFFAIMD